MIGTKGRDIVLWLFFMFSFFGIFSSYMLYPMILCALLLAKFYFYERKKIIEYRQVVLMPISPILGRLLIKKYKLQEEWSKAYEVHILFDKKSVREQRNSIVSDIKEISKQPGLYIWETHVGIPMPVKMIIKNLERSGAGFFKEGVFLPRPPFVYIKRKSNKLCHGAAIVKED